MIILPDRPLVFRVMYLDSNGDGVTGLTPTVNLYKTTIPGLVNTTPITGAATTEISAANFPGIYEYILASGTNTESAIWLALFLETDASLTQKEIATQWYVLANQAFGPPGVNEFTCTVTNSVTGLPEQGVTVWITTDIAGTNTIWSGTTNTSGIAVDGSGNKPWLDDGTYYVWKSKPGFSVTNPQTITLP